MRVKLKGNDPLQSVLYVSVADPGLGQNDIAALVDTSRANNIRDKLTGALFYNGQNFLQLLEGPNHELDMCLARIEADQRHNGMIVLQRRPLEVRNFPGWAMFHSPQFRPTDDTMARLALTGRLDPQDGKIIEAFLALGKSGQNGRSLKS